MENYHDLIDSVLPMINTSTVVQISVSIFTVFLWQHIFRINDIKYKPSYFITKAAIVLETVWNTLGTYLALFSSFYHYMYFYAKELVISLMEISTSLLRFVSAPCYLIYGFLETAASYVKPHLVWAGGMRLVALSLGVILYLFPTMKMLLSCFILGFVITLIYMNRSSFGSWFESMLLNLNPQQEPTKTKPRTRRNTRQFPSAPPLVEEFLDDQNNIFPGSRFVL